MSHLRVTVKYMFDQPRPDGTEPARQPGDPDRAPL